MKSKSRFFLFLIYLAFFACLLPVAIFTYKHPQYNFDMLGYMALVIRMDQTHDINQIHAATYEKARQIVPADDYRKLTEGLSFRKRFATDPSEFSKLLPVYIVKPLYVWLCYLFYKAGFSLPQATVMPSITAYFFIGLFLFSWLKKYLQIFIAFLSALLIMFSMFTVNIAGLSTPDCLSALFLFVAVYFVLEKQSPLFMFIFFLLSVFVRVDNVIVCFFIISFLFFSPKWRRINKMQYLLMLLLLAIAYIFAILPVTQFGWNLFYYSQYARHIDFSRDFDKTMDSSSYMSLVFSKLVTAMVSTQFTFFMFLSLLIIGNPFVSPKKFTFDQSFLLLLLFVIFFRFLLLPDLSDRFYFGFYLVIIILLAKRVSLKIPIIGNK